MQVLPSSATAAVVLVWAVSLVAGFGLINRHAGRTPYADDFAFFPLLSLGEETTAADLWAPLNEHRLPLPKLVTWATARVVGYNPKAVMRVSFGLLAAGAMAVGLAIRHLRGGSRYCDAFVPIVLLSLGQADNFVWAVQVNFLLPAALTLFCLALIATVGPTLNAWRAITFGVAAAGLPLCGIQGQVFAVPLAGWLLIAGLLGSGSRRVVAILAALAVLAVVGACASGYHQPDYHPDPKLNALTIRYAIRLVGSGWGPAAEQLGPIEPTPLPAFVGLATCGVLVVVGVWNLRAVRDPQQRIAAGGFLAFGLGMALLCGAIAYGRAELNGGLLANRYVTLAAPLLAWAYVAAVRFGPASSGPSMQAGLCLVALGFAWPNTAWGLDYARKWHADQFRIEQDAKRGVPVSFLVEHHGRYLFPPEPKHSWAVFETLRLKKFAPYDTVPDEPKLTERDVKWQLTAAPAAVDGWIVVPARDRIRMELELPDIAEMRGLVLRTSLEGLPGLTQSELWWEEPDGVRRAVVNPLELGTDFTKRIWLGRPVRKVHLTVDGPAKLRIEGVRLLVE